MSVRDDPTQLEDDEDIEVVGSDSTDNDFQDEYDGGEMAAGIRIKGRSSQLANASMTESYSEILNSPTDSGSGLLDDVAGPSTGSYPIPKRRPGSLPTGGRNCACTRFGQIQLIRGI